MEQPFDIDCSTSMTGAGAIRSNADAACRTSPVAVRGLLWIAGLLAVLMLGFAYADSAVYLFEQWTENDNYSHGFFVPLIVGLFIWLRREQVWAVGVSPSWWGVPVVLVSMGLFVAGELATLYILLYLSFWLMLVGLAIAAIGPRACWELAFPLGFLLTMFPLPQLIEQNLSASLQLASSALGVGCLQVIGVTAFREGNVIDLGPIQLQVVEACAGLRYLFPLTSLALLCGYLFQDRWWKKVVLVASAIPLAVLLNGLRIGTIGVLVEWYGRGAAEGFMHAFEGWVVFVLSFAILIGEIWLLAGIGHDARRSLVLMWPVSPNPGHITHKGKLALSPSFAFCLVLLSGTVFLAYHLQGSVEKTPERKSFLEFPMHVADWQGRTMTLERQYVDVLRFDDYLLADFAGPMNGPVNLYAAYYRSQKKGQSAHSPRTCLPGGGWEMSSMTQVPVETGTNGRAFYANRVLIQKGDDRQVVLYWFKQRERLLTNEYMVKAWLLWDALTNQRSDGAMIRLVSPVLPGEDEQSADRRLQQFAALVEPMIHAYVPD